MPNFTTGHANERGGFKLTHASMGTHDPSPLSACYEVTAFYVAAIGGPSRRRTGCLAGGNSDPPLNPIMDSASPSPSGYGMVEMELDAAVVLENLVGQATAGESRKQSISSGQDDSTRAVREQDRNLFKLLFFSAFRCSPQFSTRTYSSRVSSLLFLPLLLLRTTEKQKRDSNIALKWLARAASSSLPEEELQKTWRRW